MKFCVGLTGGIGCGKSTVSKLFAEHGAGIVDTDVIAHQLTQTHGKAIPSIRKAFGSSFLTMDDALDRNKMRNLIFSDAIAKQRLEHLLHPLILEQVRTQITHLQARPYIIIIVPLLFTNPSFQQLVQRILVVDCTEKTQVARVVARSQMSEEEVNQVIAQQTPRADRLKQADDIINNDSSLDTLTEQVNTLHEIYLLEQNNN